MKDRPILFSAPMVRALLAGNKTQTRRTLKLRPGFDLEQRDDGQWWPWAEHPERCDDVWMDCPYGQPGDRLWVREAWRVIDVADCFAPREITAAHRIWFEADGQHKPPAGRYRPGMFMPRWASRITLEVSGVRVERLQDISEADAQAEGTTPIPDPWDHVRLACADIGCSGPQPHRLGFRELWRDINGPDSWDPNPWVWVVEFKRVDK